MDKEQGTTDKRQWGKRRILADAVVMAMHADSTRGMSDKSVAKKYGVSEQSVNLALARVLPGGRILPPFAQFGRGWDYCGTREPLAFFEPHRIAAWNKGQ